MWMHLPPAASRGLYTPSTRAISTAKRKRNASCPPPTYHSLINHGRAGFVWQKLRQPRSYDYEKTTIKGYDERLRMPKFPMTEEEIAKRKQKEEELEKIKEEMKLNKHQRIIKNLKEKGIK